MSKPFVYLLALMLPSMLLAESFKVTIDRQARVGNKMLQPGEYKIVIGGNKAEFQKGKETVTTEVKQEPLPVAAAQSYVRYTSGPENHINEIVTRGSKVRWLFP
jgi:hypothetical protein